MKEIYLDKKLKVYYSNDFIDNVIPETHPNWKLSESIKPYLIELNKHSKIQPLCSAFPDDPSSLSNLEGQSYLTIAYTKDSELTLFRQTLPNLVCKYNIIHEFYIRQSENYESLFYFFFFEPKDNVIHQGNDSIFKMGCLCNPNYYRINHVRLFFKCSKKEKHLSFWENLVKELNNLK